MGKMYAHKNLLRTKTYSQQGVCDQTTHFGGFSGQHFCLWIPFLCRGTREELTGFGGYGGIGGIYSERLVRAGGRYIINDEKNSK